MDENLSIEQLNELLAREEAHINRSSKLWCGRQEKIRDIDFEIKQAKIERYAGSAWHDSEDYCNDWRKR